MSRPASVTDTQVLIAGGGPIGLALAADLGRRGVRTLLVERNENRIGSAKMLEVGVRTMEFCRQLGIASRVRHWGFPFDWPLDSAFVTSMTDWELGRVRTPALGVYRSTDVSPERGQPCPQTWFDPILQECARSFPSVTIRHRVRLDSFMQDDAGVTATLTDLAAGRSETVRADFLVGCDGFASTVRDQLGIAVRGDPHIDWSMTISYDYERRPASARAAEVSLQNYRRLTSAAQRAEILSPTPAGDAARRAMGAGLVEENEKSWHPVGVHLGHVYHPSPIVVPNGTPAPADDTFGYVPTAFPGARAPHAWLAPDKSTLDLFGDGFVLLAFADVATEPLARAAATRAVPLAVHRIDDPKIAALYAARLVLVRPDGHVAWRGDALPPSCEALIDTVRGAGARVAARRATPAAAAT